MFLILTEDEEKQPLWVISLNDDDIASLKIGEHIYFKDLGITITYESEEFLSLVKSTTDMVQEVGICKSEIH